MYDWANSAYITTVATGILPAYFAGEVVGPEGIKIGNTGYGATTLWGFNIGFAALISLCLGPILGAISDISLTKKKFLLGFAYTGSLFSSLIYFCQEGDVFKVLSFFLVSQVAFICANVFYDAFLPKISSEEKINLVSGKGYSYGYLGGGIQFGLSLALILGHKSFGISQNLAARLGIVLAGFWWAGFSLFTAKYLPENPLGKKVVRESFYKLGLLDNLKEGIARTLKTIQLFCKYRHLLVFLLAFMFYNDGIQTVINMSVIYGKDELGLETKDLMVTLFFVQAVAALGAIFFSRLSYWLGTKNTLVLTLLIWSTVVIYAYFIRNTTEFFLLGVMVGLVLGGSQALSRSFYSSMIPERASGGFFGFYALFSRLSAILGPWVFSVVTLLSGSARTAILYLLIFFVIGVVLLLFVDEKEFKRIDVKGFI